MQSESVVRGFRDLRVWQQGMDLVENAYGLTRMLPSDELYGLTAQIRRAAVSVPSNVAEGHAREHLKEYLRHLSIAQGSLAELQTQIEITVRLKYVPREQAARVLQQAESLSKQLHALRGSLHRRADVAANPVLSTQHPTPNTQDPLGENHEPD